MAARAESGQRPKGQAQRDNRLTTISFAGAERGAGYPARSRGGDHERIYRRALRHSRFVRWMRAVPDSRRQPRACWRWRADNYWPTGGLRLPGEIGNLVIKGTKITMQQPRLTGYTSDARPYEFTANTAQQDITKPDFVELQQIHAKIAMADKSIVHLWADTGHYNMKTDMLDLKDNIHLVSSTGYEARLSTATVDVGKGNVVSDTPVWVKLLDGDLNAKASGNCRQGRHAALYRRDLGAAVRQATDESGSAMKRGRWIAILTAAMVFAAAAAMACRDNGHGSGAAPPLPGGNNRATVSRSRSTPNRWKSTTRTNRRRSRAT